jgi:hypothetical protein
MKLDDKYRNAILVIGLVLLIFFVSKQSDVARTGFGRSGTTNCDLNYLADLCTPGWNVWQSNNNACSGGKEYFLGPVTDYPPTWPTNKVVAFACPDGNICCRTADIGGGDCGVGCANAVEVNVSYKTILMSQCTKALTGYDEAWKVDDSLCVPHECEVNADCPKISVVAVNDCSIFWVPHNDSVQQTCSNHKCLLIQPLSSVKQCTGTQTFIQNYKWYLAGGIVLLLMIILMVPRKKRR